MVVPVAVSHSRTVWSSLAVARWRPSGLNATAVTAPVWPVRVAVVVPVAVSHSRTVWSSLAVARWRPSGLNATAVTRAGVAGEGGGGGPGGGVPQPHGLVVGWRWPGGGRRG